MATDIMLRTTSLLPLALLAALQAGCESDDGPKDPPPGDPLNFTANRGDQECTFTYSPGGTATDPPFLLDVGIGGFVISASYTDTSLYESPPGSIQITYGSPSPSFLYDSGVLDADTPGVAYVEDTLDWDIRYVEVDSGGNASGNEEELPYGETWTFTFSCGGTGISCCENTPSIDVEADGFPSTEG